MATFNVEDEVEDFTAELEAELDELLGRYQTDRDQLSVLELQRMFDLREMKLATDQQDLMQQINQTQHDAEANAEDDDVDVQGSAARDDSWGVPPSRLKSTTTDGRLMSRLERKMREMVKNEFYSHLDQENSASGRDNFVKAPKTGINTMLSRSGENVWKVRTRNMYYSGPTNKSHDLAYCLSVHKEIAEKANLTSDAGIDLLKRILQGEPFKLCQNLHRGKSTIDRIYIYLQSTYKDSVSAIKAARLLVELVENPVLIDFGKVANRILELALLAHSEESESQALKSTATTSLTTIFTYLNKYYPRPHVERIRRIHLQWSQRSENLQPLDSVYQLIDISRTQLAGLLPSHANLKRATGGIPNENKPTMRSHVGSRPFQQTQQQQQNYVNHIDDEDGLDLNQETMPDVEEDSFDEIDSVDGTRKPYSKDPSQYKETVRCRLCNCNSYTHTPPFWRFCSVFVSQLPTKTQCRACLG
jgi:hypothetical protein